MDGSNLWPVRRSSIEPLLPAIPPVTETSSKLAAAESGGSVGIESSGVVACWLDSPSVTSVIVAGIVIGTSVDVPPTTGDWPFTPY